MSDPPPIVDLRGTLLPLTHHMVCVPSLRQIEANLISCTQSKLNRFSGV